MKIVINPTKIVTAVIAAVLAAFVISNLVAVSEFSLLWKLVGLVVLPVLIGIGAATKVGNEKRPNDQAE